MCWPTQMHQLKISWMSTERSLKWQSSVKRTVDGVLIKGWSRLSIEGMDVDDLSAHNPKSLFNIRGSEFWSASNEMVCITYDYTWILVKIIPFFFQCNRVWILVLDWVQKTADGTSQAEKVVGMFWNLNVLFNITFCWTVNHRMCSAVMSLW